MVIFQLSFPQLFFCVRVFFFVAELHEECVLAYSSFLRGISVEVGRSTHHFAFFVFVDYLGLDSLFFIWIWKFVWHLTLYSFSRFEVAFVSSRLKPIFYESSPLSFGVDVRTTNSVVRGFTKKIFINGWPLLQPSCIEVSWLSLNLTFFIARRFCLFKFVCFTNTQAYRL